MPEALPPSALDWVEQTVGPGSRATVVAALPGTSFHSNHAIDVADADGGVHALVLRRWMGTDWLESDAEYHADREASILRLLHDSSVPAPVLVASDALGERCGVPALLVTRLPGRPPGRPGDPQRFLRELAAVAAAIHSVDGAAREEVPAYRRYCEPAGLAVPEWAHRPDLWERAIAVAREPPPPGREVLVHRDLHPGNTLWEGGRISGVVDWSYGSWGAAAIDTAHLRWNLALDLGPAFADELLVAGEPLDHHGYWDLVDVLDLVCEPSTEAPTGFTARRLEDYVARVLRRL